MKILQINTVCGIGSTGRIATDIHGLLVENGHESHIAYGRNIPINCENTIKIGDKVDVYKHMIKTRVFDEHGFGSKKATMEFIEKIDILDPDIIHLHNVHGYYINIEILFSYLKKLNKPIVWTLHDCWSFTGHCAYFDYVGCDKWKTGCFNCPEKKSYPRSVIIDNSENNYHTKKSIFSGINKLILVTPSVWLSELIKESYLCDYSVRVINNGIDLDTFQPKQGKFRENNNLAGKFIILGVASEWNRRKGLKYFLELADNLSHDEVIVLVGLSEKQMKQIPNNIIGISRTNNVDELVEIYSNADIFLNPTLEDNFPTTNIESLACGTPVITFNTGGSVESIDSNTGAIVYLRDSNHLYKEIVKFRKRDDDISAKCVNRVKELYNKKYKYKEYIKLYEEMVEQR